MSPTKQKLSVLALALVALSPRFGLAQSVNVPISTAFATPGLAMLTVTDSIQEARFISQPYTRKVAATPDDLVGAMTYGVPPQMYGHASIVFQYYPATNTVNIFPGQAHVKTWWGNQICWVYEDGTCNQGTNPNWQLCSYPPLAGYRAYCIANAISARILTIQYLQARGYTVTENAAVLAAGITAEKLRAEDIVSEDAESRKGAVKAAQATSKPDPLFMSKEEKKTPAPK